MGMKKYKQPTAKDYKDTGMTKQSFKDETDINKILARAQVTGSISHLNKHEGAYGDFTGFDFSEAQLKLAQGRTVFDELPSEIRNEFNQEPAAFFKFVNDPKNKDKLAELLPALAAPGKQFINANGNIKADEAKAATAADQPTAAPTGTPAAETPPAASQAATPSTPAQPSGDSSAST